MPQRAPKPLRFIGAGEESGGGIGVAPLVDIVLLLICFYLFVSKSIQSLDDPAVELPVMTSRAVAPEKPAELVLNLRADGTLIVNQQEVVLDRVGSIIGVERDKALRSGRPLRVVLRADRAQRFGELDELMQACRVAGVDRLVLRSTQGEP